MCIRDRIRPKGKKAWALARPAVRRGAGLPGAARASLLFADADVPLGALRWNLAELRRVLGDSSLVRGAAHRASTPGQRRCRARGPEAGEDRSPRRACSQASHTGEPEHRHRPTDVGSDRERGGAMPLIQVKLIEGVFDEAQKQTMAQRLTDTMVEIEGENT